MNRPLAWLSNETPAADGSGGQRRQYHQVKALVQAGIDVHVITFDGPQDDASIRAITPTSRYRPAVHRSWSRPRPSRDLDVILGTHEFTAAIVAHDESLPPVLPTLAGLSLPYAVDFQNVNSRWWELLGDRRRARSSRRLERLALFGAEMVTCCSAQEREALAAYSPTAQLAIAPNGVDPAEWPESAVQSGDDPTAVIFASWSHPPNQIGLKWFLEAVWPMILAARPQSRLVLAGPGDVPPIPDSLAGIEVVGRVDDLAVLLGAARLIAVPIVQGMGARMKFGEGLASGTAVVSTSIGAEGADAPDLFLLADDADAFARACTELFDDEKRARELGLGARRWALEKLAWSRTVAPMREFYERCEETDSRLSPPERRRLKSE